MKKIPKVIIGKLSFLLIFCLCFSTVTYLALAASDSVQVGQVVGQEGNGTGPENAGGGMVLPFDATPPQVTNLNVTDVTLHGARVSFTTDEVCTVSLYYGRDKSSLSGPLFDHVDSFAFNHSFALSGLDAGSKYYLKIIIRNQRGIENSINTYDFYTIPEFTQVVPDVGSLSATEQGRQVLIKWQNPATGYQGIQINRQLGSPALSPQSGERVFLGFADHFVDAQVADQSKYYYTVFAFDAANRYSAGAVVSIRTDFPASAGNAPSGSGTRPSSPSGTQPTQPASPSQPESPIKDVRNLKALPDLEQLAITLTWQFSENEEFSVVEIRRDLNFPSLSPLEGDLVYSGSGTSFTDKDVRKGQVYFYTVFVKDAAGRYSRGAVIASELKEAPPETPDQDRWKDMSFVDVASGMLLTPRSDQLSVLAGRTLGVNYGVANLPADLSAVAIQMEGSSYLLQYDAATRSYKTSLLAPGTPGQYSFDLVFLDATGGVLFEKDMQLTVLAPGQVYAWHRPGLLQGDLSWDRILCRLGNLLGRGDASCLSETAVAGAQLEVYKKNQDGVWEVWNAQEFNQANPFLTDDAGRYELYLPSGDYELGVRKDGFQERRFPVSVADNILHEKILIQAKHDYRYGLLVLAVLLIAMGWMVKKRSRFKQKK